MYWGLDHGPVNIWCEFEEDWLKALFCRMHTRKNEVSPQMATNVTENDANGLDLNLGSVNIWCEFEEDQLKTRHCRVHT